jgi:uncharacterized membrane protein YgdD (TMEM256/DUF423 family)
MPPASALTGFPMIRLFLICSALGGLLAVALGAFGAHALKAKLAPDLLAVWHTAVQYQFYHVLALLAVALLMQHDAGSVALKVAGVAFIAGIVIFSGSLYVLCLSGIRWLGAITPLGGTALLAGWLALLVFAWQWSQAR